MDCGHVNKVFPWSKDMCTAVRGPSHNLRSIGCQDGQHSEAGQVRTTSTVNFFFCKSTPKSAPPNAGSGPLCRGKIEDALSKLT